MKCILIFQQSLNIASSIDQTDDFNHGTLPLIDDQDILTG